MSAPLVPSDAELVAGVLGGDRAAFAAVYDRYGDRLYDFAHSMLRHRDDASDAVADSFILVAERLSQLREPDRLRPWLYAIVRSECLRRIRSRDRIAFGGDEAMVDMADQALRPDEAAEASALQTLVWDAVAGLGERDRALMDLHLRQGLEGAELGEAMGVSAANAYSMLTRMRDQVERSLGALLVARTGRDDCGDLDAVLDDWDGDFSPLIRKRVARHVDGCKGCTMRRAAMMSPLALFAGVPAMAAPAGLRDRILDGFQAPAPAPNHAWLGRAAHLAAVVVFLGAAVTGAVVLVPHEVADVARVLPTPSQTTATSSPSPTVEATTASPSPTPVVTVAPPAPTPKPTRSPAPPRDTTGPTVGRLQISGCGGSYTISAVSDDPSGVSSVSVAWSGSSSGSAQLARSGGAWTTTIRVATVGDVTIRATATDGAGNTSSGPAVAESFDPCPQ